jgi:sec-independent protein translocase protein TatB
MFDLDVSKLLMVGVVALVVIGPKDLPRVLRVAGQVMGKMRRVRSEVQSQFADLMKEAGLDEAKKEFEAIDRAAYVELAADPRTAVRGHLPGASAAPPDSAEAGGEAAPAEEIYASPEMRAYLDPTFASESAAIASEAGPETIEPEGAEAGKGPGKPSPSASAPFAA